MTFRANCSKRIRWHSFNDIFCIFSHPQTQTALIYDAVHLVSKALANANVGSDWKVEQLSCYGRKSWEFGLTVYNYIKRVSYGIINFILCYSYNIC